MLLRELRDTKKLGRIVFNMDDMMEMDEHILRGVMSNLVVLDTQVMLHNRTVTYFALSPIFDPVPEGHEIPVYQVNIGLDSEKKEVLYFNKITSEGEEPNETSNKEEQSQ